MAIEGLKSANQLQPSTIRDEVEASVEALDILGLVEDRDQVAETLAGEFTKLGQSGKPGVPYVQLPRGIRTLREVITASDEARYPEDRGYPPTFIDAALWTPGTSPESYNEDDLGNLEPGQTGAKWLAHSRLAVYNTLNSDEPLLHFLDQPIDWHTAAPGQQPQLNSLWQAKQAYELAYPHFRMTPLNAAAVAMLALTRRIKGQQMPMAWGFMRDATLPTAPMHMPLAKPPIAPVTRVGRIYSDGGRIKLDMSTGRALPNEGVGISIGPELF